MSLFLSRLGCVNARKVNWEISVSISLVGAAGDDMSLISNQERECVCEATASHDSNIIFSFDGIGLTV